MNRDPDHGCFELGTGPVLVKFLEDGRDYPSREKRIFRARIMQLGTNVEDSGTGDAIL